MSAQQIVFGLLEFLISILISFWVCCWPLSKTSGIMFLLFQKKGRSSWNFGCPRGYLLKILGIVTQTESPLPLSGRILKTIRCF